MSRALVVLLGGIVVTLLAVVAITPIPLITSRGFVLVLLTMLAGAAVMAVVARRARQRERAADLAAREPDTRLDRGHVPGAATATDLIDEEPDRG